jgi:hypothetical protein
LTVVILPVATFQTWILPPLAYATRGHASASVRIALAVRCTLFGCGLAVPAWAEATTSAKSSRTRDNPATRSRFVFILLTSTQDARAQEALRHQGATRTNLPGSTERKVFTGARLSVRLKN